MIFFDPPVNALSPIKDIGEWIAELDEMAKEPDLEPSDLKSIARARASAVEWIRWAREDRPNYGIPLD